MSTASELDHSIRDRAKELGFSLVGIAPAARPDTFTFLQEWLTCGNHGEMEYIPRREEAYAHPKGVLPDVRSLVLVGMNYSADPPVKSDAGKIARYAQSPVDYHDVLREKLKQLSKVLHEAIPDCRTRVVVDTAPLLERDFARKAGLGWFGKNTMLINKYQGSYFFIGAILTDVELPPDPPHDASHCGTCTRCLEACPTDAFSAPYELDARRCISYLTIELRDQSVPLDLREGVGDWLFGCDVCQEVCPWNRQAPVEVDRSLYPTSELPSARDFLSMSEEAFRANFRKTPLWRTGRVTLARNAAIVLGNAGDVNSIATLAQGLQDLSPVVRGACAWALGRISNPQTREILVESKQLESDVTVLREIDIALQSSSEG